MTGERVQARGTSPLKGEVGPEGRVGIKDTRFDRTRQKTQRARRLRKDMTDAERALWKHLRQGQLGVSFRRQHPIGEYVLDFYCGSLGLAIEVDGGQHGTSASLGRDAARTDFLAARGIAVLRFWNNEVLQNIEGVLDMVRERVVSRAHEKKIPTPTLPFSRGGGDVKVDR